MSHAERTGSLVAVFTAHKESREAVTELRRTGSDMKNLSIIGRDDHAGESANADVDVGGPYPSSAWKARS